MFQETAMTSAHKNFTYEPDDENAYKELDFREQRKYKR